MISNCKTKRKINQTWSFHKKCTGTFEERFYVNSNFGKCIQDVYVKRNHFELNKSNVGILPHWSVVCQQYSESMISRFEIQTQFESIVRPLKQQGWPQFWPFWPSNGLDWHLEARLHFFWLVKIFLQFCFHKSWWGRVITSRVSG